MKFKVGDKIKYRDFLVEDQPWLAGTFVVDEELEGEYPGYNLVSSTDFYHVDKKIFVCSADFELAK